jgi:hypothetical protein
MKSSESSSFPARFSYAGLLLACLTLLSGCVEKSTNGDIVTFKYESWVLLSLLVGGGTATFISRLLPDRTDGWFRLVRRARLVLLIGGILAALSSTSCYFEKIVLSPTEITDITGVWGSRTIKIQLQELDKVELIKEVEGIGSRNQKTNFFLLCSLKNGSSEKLPLTTKISEAALRDIVDSVKRAQVPLFDKTENQ